MRHKAVLIINYLRFAGTKKEDDVRYVLNIWNEPQQIMKQTELNRLLLLNSCHTLMVVFFVTIEDYFNLSTSHRHLGPKNRNTQQHQQKTERRTKQTTIAKLDSNSK